MRVRAAVFDVRGKAAWGASARGFGEGLSDKAFRGLVVPLNQDTPFRQVFETGGHVDLTAEGLRKNRNVLDRLKPHPGEPILLLPIRSAGSVSAIFYADPGGKGGALPVDGAEDPGGVRRCSTRPLDGVERRSAVGRPRRAGSCRSSRKPRSRPSKRNRSRRRLSRKPLRAEVSPQPD